MFRFLIVEDVRLTRTLLEDLLNETFPGSHVDSAETVAQGLVLIEKASECYHAAILDFRLPQGIGASPEIDIRLCQEVRTRMRDVLVVHITGYMADRIVTDHINKAHNAPEDIRFMVSKSDPNWGSTLLNELERFLYSKRLNEGLDNLFGPEPTSPLMERRLRKEGHITHQLAGLKLDLEELWEKPLDDRLRSRVQKHFKYWESEGRFTLILPGSCDS